MIKDVVYTEKIKNKRLISWAYIWRFLVSILVFYVITYLASDLIVLLTSTTNITNVGDLAIYSAKVHVLSRIVYAVIFSITIILSWLIIHKVVSKKVSIEKQNEKYVLRMVGIITGVILIIIASASFLIEPIAETFGLGNSLTTEETRAELNRLVANSKDMQDLVNQEIISPSNSEMLLNSLEMFDFDVEKTAQELNKYSLLNSIGACVVLFVVIYTLITNHKKIKGIVVDNSLDENGMVIPTQDKINNKNKKKLITGSIVLAIIVAIICTLTYRENHKYDFLFNNDDNKHELIRDSSCYHEEEINNIVEYDQSLEEPNEEWLEWRKLEYEKEWYLNNQISFADAKKFQANYPDYSIDQIYANSMYKQVEQFIKELNSVLNDSDNKSLFFLEEKYNIKFSHIDFNTYGYVLDNKNFLTGVGVEVIVDNYIDRNVLDINMWDIYGIMQKIKKEKEFQETKVVDIDNKLSLIYADMTPEEVISILGNSYIFKNKVKLHSEDYTWIDENQNYIVFTFNEGKIQYVVFYKNALDI